jgi:D-alanyl-D-alanine-carboxypeptidase/D-alanyl-D-alanine-endopeptidase
MSPFISHDRVFRSWSTALAGVTAVLCCSHLAVASDPAGAGAAQFDLERTKRVLTELIETALKEKGIPSISIALVRGDEIVWKEAFGYANVRTKTPATPETLYNTGSTLKAVTATALMQLAEQGKFKLDDPISGYLGDLKLADGQPREKQVTFTHLLSHWSGLTTKPGVQEAGMKPIWSRATRKTLEEIAPKLWPTRAPETKFEDSNYGYGLAGLLLERISGVEYEKYLCENVLRPLGITTARPIEPSPEMVELMALPYSVAGPSRPPRPTAQVYINSFPAGNAHLTAEEMVRFLGAQINGGTFQGKRILSAESVKLMHEARFDGNYGFGFRIHQPAHGGTLIRHTGRLPGMSAMMMGDTDSHVGVYYMANATDVPPEIADAAIALLRGEPYPPAERQVIQVDPGSLQRYTGSYQLGEDVFDLSVEDGKLLIQKNKNKKAELLAETPTMFFLKGDRPL